MRQFTKSASGPPGKALIAGSKPQQRQSAQGKPATIVLQSGSVPGTCLNCPDTPCVYFRDEEIVTPVLKSFPFNRSREVCPFGALSVDTTDLLPIIDEHACVGCALCISRCPPGALYINKHGTISLNDDENEAFATRLAPDAQSYGETVAKLNATPRSGSIYPIEEAALQSVMSSIGEAKLSSTNQKLLVRNLLICLGAKAAFSSVGDTNVRIDMWWESSGVLWVSEVDFDLVSLVDSPRGLLDDVAVCISRHGVPRNKIGAMIVNMEFPNKRSDYYHLIEDIKKVTKLEILTLPIAALLLALWVHRDVGAIDLTRCVATRDHEDTAACVRSFVKDNGILRSRYFCATK